MSDWQVGDLAVCVDSAAWVPDGLAPVLLRQGAVYTVLVVTPITMWACGHVGCGLVLKEVLAPRNPRGDFPAARFRKILPDKHEACEEEFVTLLNRTKRTVRA